MSQKRLKLVCLHESVVLIWRVIIIITSPNRVQGILKLYQIGYHLTKRTKLSINNAF